MKKEKKYHIEQYVYENGKEKDMGLKQKQQKIRHMPIDKRNFSTARLGSRRILPAINKEHEILNRNG